MKTFWIIFATVFSFFEGWLLGCAFIDLYRRYGWSLGVDKGWSRESIG